MSDCDELTKELKEAKKKLKEAKRTIREITAACAAVSETTAKTLSIGNHPRGYWSRLCGQADTAATVLRILGRDSEIKQIRRRKAGLFGGKLFNGFFRG